MYICICESIQMYRVDKKSKVCHNDYICNGVNNEPKHINIEILKYFFSKI